MWIVKALKLLLQDFQCSWSVWEGAWPLFPFFNSLLQSWFHLISKTLLPMLLFVLLFDSLMKLYRCLFFKFFRWLNVAGFILWEWLLLASELVVKFFLLIGVKFFIFSSIQFLVWRPDAPLLVVSGCFLLFSSKVLPSGRSRTRGLCWRWKRCAWWFLRSLVCLFACFEFTFLLSLCSIWSFQSFLGCFGVSSDWLYWYSIHGLTSLHWCWDWV